MNKHDQDEFHKQLPLFSYGDSYTTPIGDNPRPVKVIEVTCGRAACGQTFIVPVKTWKSVRMVARPCPFCMQVSRLGKYANVPVRATITV